MTGPLPHKAGRYWSEPGHLVIIEVPDARALALLQAIEAVFPMDHGDYDRVSFASCPGRQRVRAGSRET